MKWTRRSFLEVSAAGTAGLLLPHLRREAALQPRVGLFFASVDIPLMQEYLHSPTFSDLYRSLTGAPERLQSLIAETSLEQGYRYLQPLSAAIVETAFLAVLTADASAIDEAIRGVEYLMRFPRWDYLIEENRVIGMERAAAATLATSVVLDWLGEKVPADRRQQWLLALRERGIESCYLSLYRMHHPETMREWKVDPLSGYFVFNPNPPPGLQALPTALYATGAMAAPLEGLVIGMLTYVHYAGMDSRSARWNRQVQDSWALLRRLFAADGTFRQGVSVAADVAPRMARITEALRRRTGEDLFDLVNWQGFITSLRELRLTSYDAPDGYFYLGDAEVAATASTSRWVARRARDAYAQWTAEALQQEDIWSLLWYTPRVKAVQPERGPHLWVSELAWAVARSGHGREDLAVGMVSGSAFSPLRADRNSLMLKAFGERLIVTPHVPTATELRGIRETASVSGLLIEGRGQWIPETPTSIEAERLAARLIGWGEQPGYTFWKSDATEAYRAALADVRSVTRTVVVVWDFPAVLVLDKVQKTASPSVVQARFFGHNPDGALQLTVDESVGTATMRRPHAGLHIHSFAIGGVRLEQGELVLHDTPYPFVECRTETPSRNPFLITVLLPVPVKEEQPLSVGAEVHLQPDGTYRVELRQPGKTLTLRIWDTAEVPEFERID